VGHRQAALGHHLRQIPEAQLEAQVPPHAQDDDLAIKVSTVKQPIRVRMPGHRLALNSPVGREATTTTNLHQSPMRDLSWRPSNSVIRKRRKHLALPAQAHIYRRSIMNGDTISKPSIPTRLSLPPCSRPSRTLRAACGGRLAILDRRSARQPHQSAGRDGRMAPPGAEPKNVTI